MAEYVVDFTEKTHKPAFHLRNTGIVVTTNDPIDYITFSAGRAALPDRLSVTIWPASSGSAAKLVAAELNNEREDFLAGLYQLDARAPQEAVDVIVDRLDDLQNAGDLDEVEAILLEANPAKLSSPSIVSILGITLAARKVLFSRMIFYRRALRAVASLRGSEAAAEKLLAKYR